MHDENDFKIYTADDGSVYVIGFRKWQVETTANTDHGRVEGTNHYCTLYLSDGRRYKIENKFLESKESLDRVMYSVLRVKDQNQANELYIQIEEKESTFAELVSNYSTGSEKNFNGIINNFSLKESLIKGTELSTKIIQKIGARI